MNTQHNFSTKVSIVLPTYNQGKYLINAVDAILKQTYADFELIIVNDGSTDNTASLLTNMNHPKIRVINQHNQGLPSALNNGFSAAKGEYWTWTSTDNIVAANWLEELVSALENSPAEVGYAFSYYAVIDENEKILFVNKEQRFDLPHLLLRNSGNASFLYRATLAKSVGNYDTQVFYAEDLDMWIRMAQMTRAVQVPYVLYYYRHHQQSMTTQQEKVRQATTAVINKYLAKTAGKFDIDHLFPAIKLSKDPLLERWKSRIWLVGLGASALFYSPVEALVDQVQLALTEHYDRGLIGNIVHLYAKIERWDLAAEVVSHYQKKDPSDFLTQLAGIVAKQSKEELLKIPFMTLEEKLLANDCTSDFSQNELLKNLFPYHKNTSAINAMSFDKLANDLINQLEDMQDHPEVWHNIASLNSQQEKDLLSHLRMYLTELIKLPQDPRAMILLVTLEAVCYAYTVSAKAAKDRLQSLITELPHIAVLKGALTYLNQDPSLVM